MAGPKFQDSKGRVVSVMGVEGNIAQLTNGERVSIERLNDSRYYQSIQESSETISNTPVMDVPVVENVETSRYEKLISGSSIVAGEEGDNRMTRPQPYIAGSRAVTPYSEVSSSGSVVESHSENLRDLGLNEREINKEIGGNKVQEDTRRPQRPQQPHEASTTAEQDLINKYAQTQPQQDSKLQNIAQDGPISQNATMDDINSGNTPAQQYEEPVHTEFVGPSKSKLNPVYQMFDKAKKVHLIKVNLKIDEKIPDKEIIKMMEQNFEESAIEYYASDIFRKLMSNPDIIENQVKEAIRKYVNSRTRKPKPENKEDDK